MRITCGIEAGNTAVLRYRFAFDPAGLRLQDVEPARRVLDHMKNHHGAQGFTVWSDHQELNAWTLTAFREQACDTPGEAADALRGWMTDASMTPFETTSVQWTATQYESAYYLDVTLDLTGLLKGDDPDSMPPDIRDLFEQGVSGASGTLILALPGDEILESGGETFLENGQALCVLPLSLDAPVRATLMTGLQAGPGTWSERMAISRHGPPRRPAGCCPRGSCSVRLRPLRWRWACWPGGGRNRRPPYENPPGLSRRASPSTNTRPGTCSNDSSSAIRHC